MRIQFILEIMRTNKNNDKNKTNYPPSPFTQVTVFFITRKLLSLRLIFRLSGFFDELFCEKIERNCIRGLVFITSFLQVGRKKIFF